MSILNHDPREYIRMVQQILASDTKRIGFLFGAGTSIATKPGVTESKIPGVKEMTEKIIKSITDAKYVDALKKIKEEFKVDKKEFYIEYILSTLIQKINVVGSDKLCGLTKKELEELKKKIELKIIELVSVHKKLSSFREKLIQNDFALWIKLAQRKYPIEVFTTNYDYLFEIAFENKNIPYFDGFIGSFQPFFFPAAVEDSTYYPKVTKLWKIHGSLGWKKDDVSGRIYRDQDDSTNIIIYPSALKYQHSQKLPYLSFMDRLKAFLKEDDGIIITCGYSYGDEHINESLLQGLSMTKTSHVIAFFFDDFDEASEISHLAKAEPRLSIYGKDNAVINGKFGKWKINVEPNKEELELIKNYFEVPSSTGTWTGEGKLRIVDFESLTEFLTYIRGIQ